MHAACCCGPQLRTCAMLYRPCLIELCTRSLPSWRQPFPRCVRQRPCMLTDVPQHPLYDGGAAGGRSMQPGQHMAGVPHQDPRLVSAGPVGLSSGAYALSPPPPPPLHMAAAMGPAFADQLRFRDAQIAKLAGVHSDLPLPCYSQAPICIASDPHGIPSGVWID